MIGFYNISVILTYVGLMSSLFGMANLVLAPAGDPTSLKIAFLCLVFSGFCDMFDGKIARMVKRTQQEKEFGIQIDSLCDLICFGVYPAFIVVTMSHLHWISMIAGGLFVLGGVIRLGYFNVDKRYFQQRNCTSSRFSYLSSICMVGNQKEKKWKSAFT